MKLIRGLNTEEKNMKKSLFLLFLTAVLLSSCGGGDNSSEKQGGTQNPGSTEETFNPDTAIWKGDGTITVDGLKYQLYSSSNHFRASVIGSPGISDYNITVPSTVNNKYTVYQIGERAFDKTDIRGISLPSTVTSVYKYAFNECTSLKTINLSYVKEIWDDAFWGCTSLESVTLNSSLTYIPRYCFAACHSLKTINIPSTVKNIGEDAFQSCTGLENITLPSGLTKIDNALFHACYSLSSIAIPSSVTELGTAALQACQSLNEIIIPNTVTTIGASCFGFDEQVTSIFIPSSVKTVGSGIFSGRRSPIEVYCEASEKPYNWSSTWNQSENGGQINVHWGATQSQYQSAKQNYSFNWKGHKYVGEKATSETFTYRMEIQFNDKEWKMTIKDNSITGLNKEVGYGFDPSTNIMHAKLILFSTTTERLELTYNSSVNSFTITSTNHSNGAFLTGIVLNLTN